MRTLRKKQILIVEDNQLDLDFLKEILSETYIIQEAKNAIEALEILQSYKHSVDLILLDVFTSQMDGYSFLEQLKEDTDYAAIPVIVMTQEGGEEEQIRALSCGASDFLPKPYRPQFILHIIENILTLRENSALANEYRYDRLTGLYSKGFFCKQV